MTRLYEIVLEVRNLRVELLFNEPPTIGRICECISDLFSDHAKVEEGIISLLLSIGDHEDRRATVFEVGDEIAFMDDKEQIGCILLRTRTLFDV